MTLLLLDLSVAFWIVVGLGAYLLLAVGLGRLMDDGIDD